MWTWTLGEYLQKALYNQKSEKKVVTMKKKFFEGLRELEKEMADSQLTA